jgi:hypoxanthine-DNA glycosylase
LGEHFLPGRASGIGDGRTANAARSLRSIAMDVAPRTLGHTATMVGARPRAALQGLGPIVARSTRLVILGSFPGVASLAAQQYYAHPRNHFWPIVGALLGEPLADMPYAKRVAVLRDRGLGVWDVYASCRREGSLDANIQDAVPNDLASLKQRAPQLSAVVHNGGESSRAMRITRELGVPVWRLPSTSPANASWSFERKLEAWRKAFVQAGLFA